MSVELQDIKYKGDGDPPPSYNGLKGKDGTGYANKAFKDSDETIAMGMPPNSETTTDHDPEDELDDPNAFVAVVTQVTTYTSEVIEKHNRVIWNLFYVLLVLGYAAYFAYAMYYEFGSEASVRLLWVTCFTVFCVIVYVVKKRYDESAGDGLQPCMDKLSPHSNKISTVVLCLLYLFFIVFILADSLSSGKPYNLVSASGIFMYIILFFIFSYSPAKVRWRTVLWGIALQFIFAFIILRWDAGFQAFKWLGDRVTEFLAHSDAGAEFVFKPYCPPGEFCTSLAFAFSVLPVVVFFSTVVSVLYYIGAMQGVIHIVSWVMQHLMGTTAAESLNAAGNIFIGQTEAPLLVRPLLPKMTASELHAVMTGGFATIAGSVLAAFVKQDVPANHLLTASVMSAPAALAMSKLLYPETEKSNTTAKDVAKMEASPERNVIEAASNGASASIKLVANIAANLIAFLAILHFIDSTLIWLGHRVGLFEPELTFKLICSYVFWPIAFTMGIDHTDCRQVAKLVGVKTFFNEFLAYTDLGVLISNKKAFTEHVLMNGTCIYENDNIFLVERNVTLQEGILTDRSMVITTYALCGFANVGSIGIQLGALGAMAPEKKTTLARIAVRAMIAGNVACFMTACIAGLLHQGENNELFCP